MKLIKRIELYGIQSPMENYAAKQNPDGVRKILGICMDGELVRLLSQFKEIHKYD